MIFVTADSCRVQLEQLTKLLVSAFPGSTIYQHADLLRVPHDVLRNKVDAVFLGGEINQTGGLEFVKQLRREKPDIPVFLISDPESGEDAAPMGADGCFVLPDSERCLLDAIRLAVNKVHVS